MLSLQWPWLLLLLPLPWLLPRKAKTTAAALRLPMGLSHSLPLGSDPTPNRAWQVIAVLIWLLAVGAATRPLWLGEPVALKREGRDLMVAVDLSGSMRVEDMQLNGQLVDRFTMIRQVLGDFIERRDGDRLGLILFANDAYLQAPLTFDRKTVKRFLQEAELGLVGTQTAIGSAIALATKRFEQLEQSNRVLVLLTDGENTAGKFTPEQAVQFAKQANVTLYTIGVGASEIRERRLFGSRTQNPSKELDKAEASFIKLSESTGGQYFRARSTDELEQIYQAIDQLQPIEREQTKWRPQTELYPWLLCPALLLLFVTALGRRFG
ncbi:vWA domain-containing protein [Ferrimonas lipolytica]|uniref:VWA domain-containing protein n=1 Tax=Ferrimonas lipolytica TaxID=2724191 RepID=A0A6H1UEH6_9GAMM|nr:VWA domain-containing protein [Ferrimonas lipolytica]QIZ77228.1 VWA domain-containing protein [Ferrimonas lipolytica]